MAPSFLEAATSLEPHHPPPPHLSLVLLLPAKRQVQAGLPLGGSVGQALPLTNDKRGLSGSGGWLAEVTCAAQKH